MCETLYQVPLLVRCLGYQSPYFRITVSTAYVHYFTVFLRWLGKSDRHIVHLNLFMFGFEHVILGVAEKFHTKVKSAGILRPVHNVTSQLLKVTGRVIRVQSDLCNIAT